MTEELDKIKRSIRINRILLLFVLCLFFFIIVGLFAGFIQISRTISLYKPMIDSLAKVDLKGISEQIKSINVPELMNRVDTLDSHLATLAGAFKDLKEVMEPISAMAQRSPY